ncbi:MAG TPA: hypothetical protein VLW54_00885 [Candidatus Acidoferrales bacterium]|nr:hypothetical protein [Candidatus Acidoferrales bacterium]
MNRRAHDFRPDAHKVFRQSAACRLAVATGYVLIGVLVCAGTLRSADTAGVRTVTAEEFATEVERLETRLRGFGADADAAARFRDSLPERWRVGKQGVEVSAAELRELAEDYAREPGRRRRSGTLLAAELGEMRELGEELGAPEGGSARPDMTVAQGRLAQILSGKDFQTGMQGGRLELLKARMVQWLVNKLGALFERFPASREGARIVLWGVIGLLAAGLAMWLFRYFRRHEVEAAPPMPIRAPVATWSDWLREATEAAQQGRYRDAVHALYWAAVYRLEELRVWKVDRARTPREYLRLLAAPAKTPRAINLQQQLSSEQRRTLEELTREYELTWYGYRQAREPEYLAALAQAEVFGCRQQ